MEQLYLLELRGLERLQWGREGSVTEERNAANFTGGETNEEHVLIQDVVGHAGDIYMSETYQ
ncbi:hypothetical protein Mapa_012032 [Marchantia paleacea]|nr:hypothetical protein Mapa_012032 [Marchantia paleacea]